MYDKNGLNKEIEDLKKKLEELEKASLKTAEKVLGKEEKKEAENEISSADNNKDESVEETILEDEPKKKKNWWKSIPLSYRIILIILTTIISLCIKSCMENSNSYASTTTGNIDSSQVAELDKKMANQSDDERGYVVFNEKRVWHDYDLYEKNQKDKGGCFWYQPQGDYAPEVVCPATNEDIEIAKQKGTYIDDPSVVFIQNRTDDPRVKAEEDKGIDPVTLADANSTYISSNGKYKVHLKDGWIVEDVENNKYIPFKGDATIRFYGQVGEMVDTIESNTGQLVVGLTSWTQPDYTIVFKPNDPSSKMLMDLIKNQIAKDLDNEDLSGVRVIFEESCGLFTTSAHSMGTHLYKESWRGEMVYLKTSAPLRILETRVDKMCKGNGGPSDECVFTKEYYIGK